MDVCFFGDGNILKKFYVSAEMTTVSDLFTNTQTFLDMQTVGNTKYINLDVASTHISGWMSAMNEYNIGVYVDADPAITT